MARPLDGIRVLEMGQLLAGPFAGCVLGYFGAEVIKVEPPGGDPIRGWRVVRDGAHHGVVQVHVLDLDGGDLDAPGVGLLVEHRLDVEVQLFALR